MKMQESIVDDDFINNLAADWYFLSLQFDFQNGRYAEEVSDELIEKGLQLKSILRQDRIPTCSP